MVKKIILFAAYSVLLGCQGANEQYLEKLNNYRAELNSYLLQQADTVKVAPLAFFDANYNLITDASILWLPNIRYVDMKHTGGEFRPYMLVAEVSFELNGKSYSLQAYQNEQMRLNRKLFIPFSDASNGKTTYGGGRYLDVPYAPQSTKCKVDFNYAYAPVCAHIHNYSCPIVPAQNQINTEINAGEKNP
jgi:uncharacterized protein (DUF1684 family)